MDAGRNGIPPPSDGDAILQHFSLAQNFPVAGKVSAGGPEEQSPVGGAGGLGHGKP